MMAKRILIVDDSASVRQLVGFTLQSAGFEVLQAADGAQALGQLNGAIHLVITDLNMPVLDGIGLLQGVRQHATYKYTPVIVLTTESQETRKRAAKAAGATGWIVKPFKPEQLLAVVKRVIG
jgi:two-component system, chemotaxis family, chemotaxis protein CheY